MPGAQEETNSYYLGNMIGVKTYRFNPMDYSTSKVQARKLSIGNSVQTPNTVFTHKHARFTTTQHKPARFHGKGSYAYCVYDPSTKECMAGATEREKCVALPSEIEANMTIEELLSKISDIQVLDSKHKPGSDNEKELVLEGLRELDFPK